MFENHLPPARDSQTFLVFSHLKWGMMLVNQYKLRSIASIRAAGGVYLCTVKTSIYIHCDHTTRNRPIKIFDLDFYDKLNPTRILIGSYQ